MYLFRDAHDSHIDNHQRLEFVFRRAYLFRCCVQVGLVPLCQHTYTNIQHTYLLYCITIYIYFETLVIAKLITTIDWSLSFGVHIYFVFVFKLGWYCFVNTNMQAYNTNTHMYLFRDAHNHSSLDIVIRHWLHLQAYFFRMYELNVHHVFNIRRRI